MEHDKIQEELKKLADPKYKEFQSRLCPTKNNILGVRIPVIRKFAKQLLKQIDIEEYLKTAKKEYYEEVMLHGIILGSAKMDFQTKLHYLREFIPQIDNWAVCDTFCANLKQDVKKNKEEFWEFLKPYKLTKEEFQIRFFFVCMINYYIEEIYIEEIFQAIEKAKKDDYYVKMAIAWLLSVAYVKLPNQTKAYLKRTTLATWTYNKALQKMIESYRITKEEKEIIRKMKK